jgi:hypothetical protein
MNKFVKMMREECGSRNVFEDSDGWCFVMGSGLFEEICNGYGEEVEEEIEEMEGNDNLECVVGYGDDVMNCLVVKDVERLSEKEMKFIERWCGDNCYRWS